MADKQLDKYLPKLRFPEFKDKGEWETYTLEELFEIRNGYTPSKSNPIFWEGGTIPWFRMEDIRQNGHILSDSIQHITPEAVKGTGLFPAYSIIVATTATIGEHALIIADSLANQRFTFLTKRKSHDKRIDMMFFHQYMFIIDEWCKKNTNSGGLHSVNMPAFKQLVIPLPSIKEQNAISSLLSSLDECITASKEKLEQLKAHKKGLMQKLFPAPGKTLPEYRFFEHRKNEEWEYQSLGELFNRVTEKNQINNQNVLTISAQHGLVNQNGFFNKRVAAEDLTNYVLIKRGDFAYNKSRSQGFPYGAIKSLQIYEQGVVSSLYHCFRPKSIELDSYFFELYFETDLFNSILSRIAQEGARNHGLLNISADVFFDIKIPVPQPEEQKTISACFYASMDYINKLSMRIAQLEDSKKGLMQQMFPTLR